MILVLSSQSSSLLILVSDGNVFSVISTFERNWPSSFTFLRKLLSHCNSSICPFGVLPYVTNILTELVLSNNLSPKVSICIFYKSLYLGTLAAFLPNVVHLQPTCLL